MTRKKLMELFDDAVEQYKDGLISKKEKEEQIDRAGRQFITDWNRNHEAEFDTGLI